MPRPEKVEEVQRLEARLRKAAGVILTDFRGLTVGEITTLRGRLREAGAEYRVVKNRLLGIASSAVGIRGLDRYLEGPTAAAFVERDPAAAAKVIQEFIRQTRKLALKGSVVEGQVYDEAQTRALADLPGRGDLLAHVLSALSGPPSSLAGLLAAPMRECVSILEQRAQPPGSSETQAA
ncbi:MAG: 50S ribosomal protein L10 [Armatimonadetes bacterium]|nr:50S ribosomal protein L10 [Armatimonadota bacterium]